MMDDLIAACITYDGNLEVEDFHISEEPVYILGRQYSTKTDLEVLRGDVQSRIWFTYRRNFPQIGDSGYTSDKGWGCMLRCGQMVLAEAISRLQLGRDWVWTNSTIDTNYLRLMQLFEDTKTAPFSLHIIAQMGVDEGKPIGEWYGPNTVAQVVKKLTSLDMWNDISVHVALDNIVVINEIKNGCQINGDRNWAPLLLFVPLRLGLTEINPIYVPGIQKCLQMPQSIGLIGGKPNHALYFIGFVGDEIVYLDPHTTQDAAIVGDKSKDGEVEADRTYHCAYAQRMNFSQLDPSLAVCFFCASEKEFDDLCNRLQRELIDVEKSSLFELVITRPDYMKDDSSLGAVGLEFEDHHLDSDDDEFEVLG